MSGEQHTPTPGPWKWHWRSEDGIHASGSVYSEPREGHAYAVAMSPRYDTRKQWEANARLISAAPDMLAALKALTTDITQSSDAMDAVDMKFFEDALAAIAKAEGRSS